MENENKYIQRYRILVSNRRYKEAESEIKELLSLNPEHFVGLDCLIDLYILQEKYSDAQLLSRQMIGLYPNEWMSYFQLSRICLILGELDNAKKNADICILMDPTQSDSFNLLAQIHIRRHFFADALASADESLALNPISIYALNSKATALAGLNRKEESVSTILVALSNDPTSSFLHARCGWLMLEANRKKEAEKHFLEALQIDPMNDDAQNGLSECLKSNSQIYRWLLQIIFKIRNLPTSWRAILAVCYVGCFRYLGTSLVASNKLNFATILIIVLLFIFLYGIHYVVISGSVYLRFSKYKDVLLSKSDKAGSDLALGMFSIFLTSLVIYFISDEITFLAITFFALGMINPVYSLFKKSYTRFLFPIANAVVSAVGIIGVYYTFVEGDLAHWPSITFLLLTILFPYLSILADDNKSSEHL